MEIKQIYEVVNAATKETLGETTVVTEDLQNVVDIGTALFNANAVDAYVKALVNHIGKVIFTTRKYRGTAPRLMVDGWEFGSVLEKIYVEMPDATENETWKLQNGSSYDPNVFTGPEASAKFYNKMTTFEVPMSITEKQVKQSFTNAAQLAGFVASIFTAIENALTVATDELIMRLINNMAAETLYTSYNGSGYGDSSKVAAVNLLYLYNTVVDPSTDLTAAKALQDKEFLRFAAKIMGQYEDRLSKMSKLFNIDGKARFTEKSNLQVVLLSDFAKAADAYLSSDTFHDQYVALPQATIVPFWQGSGTGYAFSSVSDLYVTTASNHSVHQDGILGVMFDRNAVMVCNENKRTTSNFNGKAEFTNYWFKQDCRYLADSAENFVVFFIEDASE